MCDYTRQNKEGESTPSHLTPPLGPVAQLSPVPKGTVVPVAPVVDVPTRTEDPSPWSGFHSSIRPRTPHTSHVPSPLQGCWHGSNSTSLTREPTGSSVSVLKLKDPSLRHLILLVDLRKKRWVVSRIGKWKKPTQEFDLYYTCMSGKYKNLRNYWPKSNPWMKHGW